MQDSPCPEKYYFWFQVVKSSFFLVCTSMFVWKVAESVLTYRRGEMGTKVELRHNGDIGSEGGGPVRMPNFAVCRHPNQACVLCIQYSAENTIARTISFPPKTLKQ